EVVPPRWNRSAPDRPPVPLPPWNRPTRRGRGGRAAKQTGPPVHLPGRPRWWSRGGERAFDRYSDVMTLAQSVTFLFPEYYWKEECHALRKHPSCTDPAGPPPEIGTDPGRLLRRRRHSQATPHRPRVWSRRGPARVLPTTAGRLARVRGAAR